MNAALLNQLIVLQRKDSARYQMQKSSAGKFMISPSELLRPDTSLRLDVGRPDHLAPLLGFVGNELPEVYRRHRHRHSAKVGEPRLHLRISQALIVLLIKLINDLEDVLLGAPMPNQPLTS